MVSNNSLQCNQKINENYETLAFPLKYLEQNLPAVTEQNRQHKLHLNSLVVLGGTSMYL